ncbi:MAG: hypothetical protein ACFE0Q_12245 [Anaerolineae bacterium]
MNDVKVSDLTVGQLRRMIKETVQEALVEVLIEINTVAEAEDDLQIEAEIAEYLRSSMHHQSLFARVSNSTHRDD